MQVVMEWDAVRVRNTGHQMFTLNNPFPIYCICERTELFF
jgi:hypothetical protein